MNGLLSYRSLTLLATFLAIFLPLTARAQYTTSSDGSGGVIITGYTGSGGALMIPSSIGGQAVTSIGANAFYDNDTLTSVTIPSGVTSIGFEAFQTCKNLISVTISSSVTSLGNYAFLGCSSLTSITIPASVTSIGSSAFAFCTSLESASFEGSAPTLGGSVFASGASDFHVYYNPGAAGFSTPIWSPDANDSYPASTVTSDFTTANFNNQLTITGYTGNNSNVMIPSSIFGLPVVAIAMGAFANDTSLTGVTIPGSVTSVGYGDFSGCVNLTTVTILSGVTSIGFEAFFGCTSLTNVTIPGSVTDIANDAFFGCTGLTSISIPSGVTIIGNYVFYGCTGLTSVTIPAGVTSVGSAAFGACTNLTSVTIPSSVTGFGDGVFYTDSLLTTITLSGTNSSFSVSNGVLFNQDQTKLYFYPASKSDVSYAIPDSVTSIAYAAFFGCTNLASVSLPAGLTSIADIAFQGCTSLVSVTFPAGVTSIGDDAFFDCSTLSSATFAGNAPTMGSDVFEGVPGNFEVIYDSGATGFSSPEWTDSAGDMYPAIQGEMSQSISFPRIATQVFPAGPIDLKATASSGLTVTYSVLSGPATIPPNSNVLTVTGIGTVMVQASQSGNSAYGAATSVDQSFAVAQVVDVSDWKMTNAITDLAATPDQDGVPNLLKYLYDIDPTKTTSTTDRSALPIVGIDSTTTMGTKYLAVTYRQYALAGGVSVHLQTSTDLLTWTTVTPDVDEQTGVDASTGDPVMEMGVMVTGTNNFSDWTLLLPELKTL